MPACVEAALSQPWRVDKRTEPFILADNPDAGGCHPADPDPIPWRP
jgi:hypothetical protein